ncbi:MAG: hypothetical protein QM692_24405 [Thermomicrobiales bacterium]
MNAGTIATQREASRGVARRTVLGLLAASPFVLAAITESAAKGKTDKRKKTFCLNGNIVKAKHKKKKNRLRAQGATRGQCQPQPSCPAGTVSIAGVCTPCTTPCAGSAAECGAELTAALLTGGTIILCPGTYAGTFTVSVDGTTLIGAGSGTDAASNSIIDAKGAGSVFSVAPNVGTYFSLLRITGGSILDFKGAGIHVDASASGPLTVANCVFADNQSLNGNNSGAGGIQTNGQVLISSTEFIDNKTQYYGGGMAMYGPDTLPLSTISDCTFTGGEGGYAGGAFFVTNQSVSVTGTTMTRNSAQEGGAIYASGGVTTTLTFDSASSITGNTATSVGGAGGIYTPAGGTVVTLNGATVTNNITVNCSNVTGC